MAAQLRHSYTVHIADSDTDEFATLVGGKKNRQV